MARMGSLKKELEIVADSFERHQWFALKAFERNFYEAARQNVQQMENDLYELRLIIAHVQLED